MSRRGRRLLEAVDGQIAELTALFADRDESALTLACPGREKLGDGTVAACALHTAASYQRIGTFLQGHGAGSRGGHYGATDVDLQSLLDRLTAGRSALDLL